MRLMQACTVAAVLCLFSVPAAKAQFGGPHGGPPSLQGIFQPIVGRGAAYEIQHQNGEKSSMELAVVGKDSAGGGQGYWIEMTFDGREGQVVMKTLSTVESNNVVVSRMIMQMDGRPPMEFPEQFLQRRNPPRSANIKDSAEDVGSETLTVPAGTFKCEHYRSKDGSGDFWITSDIAPWGLVKSQDKDVTMVLTKTITDAKDKITGTPIPFNPMMFGGAQPPSQ
ncbi:MAG TPA: hypothetical protein VMU43_11645 [Candidatus Acidoferrum sp.]|nr:hypothetical protein [Candidatus Acidoferrum sp.]